MRSRPPFLPSLALALLLAGCGPAAGEDAGMDTIVPGGFSQQARVAFDSASAALGAGDPIRARDLFTAVLEEDSTIAAAWIGLHLTSRVLADAGAADSALRRARALIEPPAITRGRGAKPAT